MKRKTWIALLSVMLGATVALAACKDEDSDAGVPQAAPQVESILSNFVNAQFQKDWGTFDSNGVYLNEQYGNYVQHENGFYLFKKVDRTPLDERSEVWTVYNAEKKEVSWTKEFKYQNGDYEGENQYDQEKHAPLEVHVEIEVTAEIPYVIVDTIEYVPYTEAEMQEQLDMLLMDRLEEEDIRSYKETETVEYYSIDGTKICESYDVLDVQENVMNQVMAMFFGKALETTELSFGRMSATFDEEGNLLAVVNEEEREGMVYAYESDAYNYAVVWNKAGVGYAVYDKDDELLYTYVIDTATSIEEVVNNIRILADGDFLFQEVRATNSIRYDYMAENLAGALSKYVLTTTRIDVDTGSQTEIDFPYVIEQFEFFSKDDFAKLLGDEYTLTDNVYNVAKATKLVDGKLGDEVYVFFDNLLNVQYEWSSMVEGHSFDLDSMRVLNTDELLVTLSTPLKMDGVVIDRAVIKQSGELVAYIPENADVLDGGMVLDDGRVYSFTGELLYSIGEDKYYNRVNTSVSGYGEWLLDGEVYDFGGGKIWTMTRTEEITDPDNPSDPPTYETYYITYYLHETTDNYSDDYSVSTFGSYSSYGGYYKNYKIIECGNSYVLLETDDGYVVYGASGSSNEIFTCKERPVDIQEYENSLVVIINANGEKQVHEISKRTYTNDFGKGY